MSDIADLRRKFRIREGSKLARPRGWFGLLRRLVKQARCNHTHCAKFDLEGATRVYGKEFGERMSKDPGVQLVACYLCGLVWVRDWSA